MKYLGDSDRHALWSATDLCWKRGLHLILLGPHFIVLGSVVATTAILGIPRVVR
jgi:hypothetical protein